MISFLGAINTFLVLMVFSLVGHDPDVHEFGLVDAILVFIILSWLVVIMMFISSCLGVTNALFVSIILFLVCCDHDVHRLLVLLMHFLCRSSSSWSVVIMMIKSSYFGVVNLIHILMVLFLVNGDHDVHEFFYWCC
jgi:hypothetical protein